MSTTVLPYQNAAQARQARPRDLSIDYLRTTLTLIVLGYHSSFAYTAFAHLDRARWVFFDYAENFNDAFLMSLMFFVSGLFVYPALRRHGARGFIRDRLLRLGLPFVFAVVFVMPVADYAVWQITAYNTRFIDFYKFLAARGYAAGPPWFIWVLLFFDVILALALIPLRSWLPAIERWMPKLRNRPLPAFLAATVLSALVYLPMLARFGFDRWVNLITSPFSFQVARIGLYSLWFLFGFLVGVPGIARGLLARDGKLSRNWVLWILGCILAFNVLWFAPRWALNHALRGIDPKTLSALLWIVSCSASCFGFLALFRGILLHSRSWMNSLTRCAYVMYLVHYVFVTWMQRLMLNWPVHAAVKFLFVFVATTFLSWLTAQAVLRIPRLNAIL